MASAANTGNPSDSEDDLTGFQDDDFEDQERIIMRTGDDLLPTSPLLLQVTSRGQQAAGATDPETNQHQDQQARAGAEIRRHPQKAGPSSSLPLDLLPVARG